MSQAHVIVVTYNSRSVIEDCLRALKNQTLNGFKLTIVDNASTDDSAGFVRGFLSRQRAPFVWDVLALSENRGFAGAHLEAMRRVEEDCIATVNPDTVVASDWLQNLVEHMLKSSAVGVCASRLLVYGSNVIDSAGDGYSTALKGFKREEGHAAGPDIEPRYVFGACAGGALYRREMLDEIGFFDEDFFLIHEDTDLNWRAQMAGWKVLYVPKAVVHHKVRTSIGTMSPTAVYYSLRNSELVRMKDVPTAILVRCLPETLLAQAAEFLYFAVRHRFFRLYLKAKADALSMLPAMLQKRKKVMALKRVSNAYLLGSMTTVFEREFLSSKVRKLVYG